MTETPAIPEESLPADPPAVPEESSPADLPDSPLSENGKRTMTRMAGTAALVAVGLTVLVTGIVIGNAARKRIYKWSHASG
jgi:hypothetical protein